MAHNRLLSVVLPLAVAVAVIEFTRADDPKPPRPLDCTGANGLEPSAVKAAQQAWAKYLGRKVEEEDEVAPGVKMAFMLIPPGKFVMGSPPDEKDRKDDETQHTVTITKPFYLAKYTVTQEQYEAVTGSNPSKFRGANLPVETVSWEDADVYRSKLTDKRRDGLVYRLPTEAEWEYSCRGGRSSSQPFGVGDGTSLSSSEANFDGNYPYGGATKGTWREKTMPVGSFQANALGLYDMHGNVWQWCADWYDKDYPTIRASDPTGPTTGSDRVFRGGSWIYDARSCRSARRFRDTPGFRYCGLGFRLARVPSGLGK